MAELKDDEVDIFSGRAFPQSSSLSTISSSQSHKFCSVPWPMVVIRDSSPTNTDLSIFPPGNHENLPPSSSHSNLWSNHPLPPSPSSPSALLINLESEKVPPLASPLSPFSFPRSDSDPSSSAHFDSDPDRTPPPTSPLSPLSYSSSDADLPPPSLSFSAVPKWWGVAFQIIRAKIGNFGSFFGCKGGYRGMVVWPFGNVGLVVAAAVMWWLWLRVRRRRWQRRNSVGHLLQIMREKDEVGSLF